MIYHGHSQYKQNVRALVLTLNEILPLVIFIILCYREPDKFAVLKILSDCISFCRRRGLTHIQLSGKCLDTLLRGEAH
jgi:hypothetical protein